MRLSRLSLLFTFILCLLTHVGQAQEASSDVPADSLQALLANPRRAVHTFIYYQQEASKNLPAAAQTMNLSNDSLETQIKLSRNLKSILDARGLLIEYDEIPNNPSYIDSLSGRARYTLFSELPNIYLIKEGNRWLFSERTIESIPELYGNTFSIVGDVVDDLPTSFHESFIGLKIWQYIAIFLWILTGFVLRKIFEFFFDTYALTLVGKTTTSWDDLLVQKTEKPISFLFMIGFFWATFTNLMLPVTSNYYLSMVLNIAFFASFVWLFYNLVDILTKYLEEVTAKTESKLDDQLVPLLSKSMKVFIVLIGIIFILQNNGINVTSLLAGLGLGGLAIALAAKDTLANFFGSITIFTDQPFQVGDLIKTSNAEGVVDEVGFRSTRLRTLYDSELSIPNSILANTEIDNLGRRRQRRLNTTLNLTYDTSPQQVEAFVEGIKAIIKSSDKINQTNYEVHFNGYGAHSLDILVYLFFNVTDWSSQLQLQHNFLLEVMRLAQEVGVEFAFPTQTLHLDSIHADEPRKAAADRSDDELVSAVYAFSPDGELVNPNGLTLKKNGEEINFNAKK